MTTRELVLEPDGESDQAGWSRVTWRLLHPDGGTFLLYHAVPVPDRDMLGAPDHGDSAIVSTLLYAMEQGMDLRVKGVVSPRLLAGVEALQESWGRWRPARYKKICIYADCEAEVVVRDTTQSDAICAFSGGVDATFTLFRHLGGHAGRGNRTVRRALLIHGMDIPLIRPLEFDEAADRAMRMLSGTGVRLLRMQTNARALGQTWEDSFGLILSGCFLYLQAWHRYAIHGSEEPYESLVLPWGSTPLTDPWCSTDAMSMEHDGCGFDRCEKVAWLAIHTRALDDLRVCWEGPVKSQNCGHCEKCIRTMLNFWAMGLDVPSAFSVALTPDLIRTLRPQNAVQLEYIKNIYHHGRQRYGSNDKLLRSVGRILNGACMHTWARDTYRMARSLLQR